MSTTRPPLRLLGRDNLLTGPTQSPPLWRRLVIVLATLICCLLLVIPGRDHLPALSPGTTPLTDVIAPHALSIPDQVATDAARDRARMRVPLVFDLAPAEIDRLKNRIHNAFSAVRSLRFPLPATAAAPEEAVARILKEHLDTALGTALLSPALFTRHLERELTDALEAVLERGVLRDRTDLAATPSREILVRHIGQPREGYSQIDTMYDLASARRYLSQMALQTYPDNRAAQALLGALQNAMLFANLVENPQETKRRRDTVANQVATLYFQVNRGDVIVAAGSPVLDNQVAILSAYHQTGTTHLQRIIGLALLTGLIFYVFFLDLKSVRSRVLTDTHRAMLTGLALVGTLALCRLTLFLLGAFTSRFESLDSLTVAYALPVATGAMLITLLLNVRTALVFSMLASILTGLMVTATPLFILYGFVTSLIGIFAVVNCQRRSQIIRAGLWVGLVSAMVALGIDLQQGGVWDLSRLSALPFALCGGLLSAVVVSALLPVMEVAFNLPTNIRLLELSDLNHPLLRNLLERAPGTYHHSMIMSNMAEQAAKAIGENALLARVGCYYHDIGKMQKPSYFIENQWGNDHNLHDKLTPSMSRLVLVSHVKDGIELAHKYKLPLEIIDMIPQHHGTRLINYFFAKAKQATDAQDPPPEEISYRYPGPRPQTKVAGIIMLADTAEAASRALDNPSPARLAALVDKMVNAIYLDHQLDECELTLKDLRRIASAFVKTLSATFHQRISYPGMTIPGSNDSPPDQSTTALSG